MRTTEGMTYRAEDEIQRRRESSDERAGASCERIPDGTGMGEQRADAVVVDDETQRQSQAHGDGRECECSAQPGAAPCGGVADIVHDVRRANQRGADEPHVHLCGQQESERADGSTLRLRAIEHRDHDGSQHHAQPDSKPQQDVLRLHVTLPERRSTPPHIDEGEQQANAVEQATAPRGEVIRQRCEPARIEWPGGDVAIGGR